jgi:DNA polymerase-3 subunit epsilon
MIHGITEEDVKDQPEFDALWDTIKQYIDGKTIVAHNASFDVSVLRHVLDTYNIKYPTIDYFCSVTASKKTWTCLNSHKLNNLASYIGFEFKHHDALEDAMAAAKIMIEVCKLQNTCSIEELSKKLQVNCGKLFPGGYTPTKTKPQKASRKTYLKSSDITTTKTSFDENHPCFKKVFIFTGTLRSIIRKDAMQLVVDNGGYCGDLVNSELNFLVTGDQDYSKLKDGKKSVKMKTAELLIQKGVNIKIISEEEFLEMVKYK